MNLMQGPLIAPAWDRMFVAKAEPVFPSETKYRQDLISKWTRNGRVPTLEQAEALEAEEYALDAMADSV